MNSIVLKFIKKSPWAITPEYLEMVYEIVLNHSEGNRVDLAAVEARNGRRLEKDRSVHTRDSIVVIPVYGLLSKRMNLFTEISGGTSLQLLTRDFRAAIEDEAVGAILLDVDSPGGTVDGTKALADLIFASRGIKPIVAFVNGQATSAAYWIASAADQIAIEETGATGSIGVITMHTEFSKADEKVGVKRTIITAGKYKGIGNDAEPLSKEGLTYIQSRLDYLYTIFVNETARNRRVSPEAILKTEGKVFIGQQAVDIGLVDTIGSFESSLEMAQSIAGSNESKDTFLVTQNNTNEIQKEDLKMSGLTKEKAEKIIIELHEKLANHTWDDLLLDSNLPKSLHDKIKGTIPLSGFVSDEMDFDEKSFKEAVGNEIVDWEKKFNLGSPSVIGGAHTNREIDHEARNRAEAEAEEDALVEKLLELAGGSDSVYLS